MSGWPASVPVRPSSPPPSTKTPSHDPFAPAATRLADGTLTGTKVNVGFAVDAAALLVTADG